MLITHLINFYLIATIIQQLNPLPPAPNSEGSSAIASEVKQPALPIVNPVTETELGSLRSNKGADADDPAIYIHPENPTQSLVITTHKKGGLRVYDLRGKEIQRIKPQKIRYNNVDIAYGVEYPSQIAGQTAKVDLAIFSDRRNDTLSFFAINPNIAGDVKFKQLPLEQVASISMPESIFGVDDGEATAYGLATYISRTSGKTYVFVSQSDGNKIAQLEIEPGFGAADELTVKAEIVRMLEVPIPSRLDPKDAFVEGMVVDRQTGMLYFAQEQFGIWKVNAEPGNTDEMAIVDLVKDIKEDSPLSADVEGLTIYYGQDDRGYLIASSQGDNTFAVYNRTQNNSYLGSFTVKNVGKTDGLDISNIPLGKDYPEGLLVVQDGLNKTRESNSDKNNIPNFKFISVADILTMIRSWMN